MTGSPTQSATKRKEGVRGPLVRIQRVGGIVVVEMDVDVTSWLYRSCTETVDWVSDRIHGLVDFQTHVQCIRLSLTPSLTHTHTPPPR